MANEIKLKLREWSPTLYKATSAGNVQVWRIRVLAEDGIGVIQTEYGLESGKKQTITQEVREGKNEGRKNATTPVTQALAMAEADWVKQITRKKYGLTAAESADKKAIGAMLAHSFKADKVSKINWDHAYAQPKLDGFRCLATITKERRVLLRTREDGVITTMEHLAAQLKVAADNVQFPEGESEIILDGELYIHGEKFEKIASHVKNVKGTDPDKQRVEYHIYDRLCSKSPYIKRAELLKPFHSMCVSVRAVETVRVATVDELLAYQALKISEGYEGAMLRHGLTPYEPGKRSSSLLKVKTFDDAEFLVVDAKEGTSTHAGMAIFVCETEDGNNFDVLAPGNHDEKRAYWKNYKKYIGHKLTVKYHGFTNTEEPVPRFPVALRFEEKL